MSITDYLINRIKKNGIMDFIDENLVINQA